MFTMGGMLIGTPLGVALGCKLLLNINLFALPIFWALWAVGIVSGMLLIYIGIKSQK